MVNFILLGIFALVGLVISVYLFTKKTKKEELVCMIGEDCNNVVSSKYGKTLGVENTLGGIIYYGAVFLVAVFMPIVPQFFAQPWVWPTEIVISSIALLFAVWLIFVQWKLLKEWCEYCVVSAFMTLGIFLVVLL